MRPCHRRLSEPYHEVVTKCPKTEEQEKKRTPLLSSERAALSESSLATGRLTQNRCATLADNDGLSVRENGGDGKAAGTLDVHEKRPRGGDESLELVFLGLRSGARVEEINGENHLD